MSRKKSPVVLKQTLENRIRCPKKLINFRVTETEFELIKMRAEAFAAGNISDWVRYAASQYEPKKSELTEKPSS